MKVQLVSVTVRRDANTITPLTAPNHEIAVLRQIFGKENVVETGKPGATEIDPAGEHERLCAKYGTPIVAKVWGETDGRLIEAIKPVKDDKPVKDGA